MRGRMARNAVALGSAGLVVLGMAGCQPVQARRGGTAQTDLKIVEQVQIDENGGGGQSGRRRRAGRSRRRRQGQLPTGVDRHGGRAQRPRRRARHQHQERRAAGHRQAQRRQPGLPGSAEAVRHRGRPAEGDRDRAADRRRPVHHRPRRPGVLRRDQGHRRRLRPGRPGRHHRVGDQPHAQRERLEDVLPWPGQRRRAGSVGRELPEERAGLQEGLRGRRQHRLRPRPGHGGARHARARSPIRRATSR